MTKIALTGATGFIGGHVARLLELRRVPFVASGRGATGPNDLHGHWVQLDIATPSKDAYECLGRPDVLIHLAWQGLPNYQALRHFEDELPRQYCFLRRLIEQGLPAVVVAGTCFEYGMQSGPLSEDTPTAPVNAYGLAKDVLRQQLQLLKDSIPFELTWARLFYVFGEGQPAGSLFPQLCRAVEAGMATFNMSGGEQLRDYRDVREVANDLIDLALLKTGAGVVNLGSGTPISVRQLVEGWIAERGWQITLNRGYHPYPDYEPMAFWSTRTKLDSILRRA
jgi:nucleoside-diphosphate-sugar epimerase